MACLACFGMPKQLAFGGNILNSVSLGSPPCQQSLENQRVRRATGQTRSPPLHPPRQHAPPALRSANIRQVCRCSAPHRIRFYRQDQEAACGIQALIRKAQAPARRHLHQKPVRDLADRLELNGASIRRKLRQRLGFDSTNMVRLTGTDRGQKPWPA